MKILSVKCIIMVAVSLFFSMMACAPFHVKPVNISGDYVLYQEGDLSGKIAGHMRITSQQNGQFLIGIANPTGNPITDWQGKGVVEGTEGYYDWFFNDGKWGRTIFSIDESGNIHGKVRGSGLNWDYIARRHR